MIKTKSLESKIVLKVILEKMKSLQSNKMTLFLLFKNALAYQRPMFLWLSSKSQKIS